MISVKNLSKTFPDGTQALKNVSVEIPDGDFIAIIGLSGAGKSTFLRCLNRLNNPSQGQIVVNGQNIVSLRGRNLQKYRRTVGFIFQQFNLLPYLSILENVLLPCGFSARKRQQAGDQRQSALRLLAQLGIPADLLHQSVDKLSVGQQQRTAVARALIGNPEIVIADEPTSALDSDNRDRFLELLFQETEAQGSTLIFVSHDQHIAAQFTHVVDLLELNTVQGGVA